MTNDFRGQRPKNDPLETVSSFLSSFGGAFTDVIESALDGAADLIPEMGPRPGKLPLEVKILDDGAIAKFDLPPGVTAEDVTVTLEGEVLEVTATRHVSEITDSAFNDRKSTFHRAVVLHSDSTYEPVSAVVTDGVLEVALSSRKKVTRHNIPVK